ncbi:MAG: hypothetical protein HZA50_05240 [Planctomycetes bacterium]|nr:hypothetical protein [Planctomycetota bacterium]
MSKVRNIAVYVLAAAVLVAWTAPVLADAKDDFKAAQNKLLAYRAARADAIRKLAERIIGLKITSETTVKNFVTQSDTIDTAMKAFLSGVKDEGKPKYAEDGVCTVTMSVTIGEVIVALKQIYNQYAKGGKIKIEDFEQMSVTYKETVFSETGQGAPRPDKTVDVLIPAGSKLDTVISDMPADAAAYWKTRVEPQGRLMAVRAARVEAMRRLGERLSGVMITSETSVRDFVAESDEINVDMKTFLSGAKETRIKYHTDELIVEVRMEVLWRTVLESFKSWADVHYRGNKINITKIEEKITTVKDELIEETGMGIPPARFLKEGIKDSVVAVIGGNLPNWVGITKRVVGNAAVDKNTDNAAQAKLMAFRAAELDARRKLAEEVVGLVITSSTSVKDFIAQNDEIRTAMLTFQQGARVVEGSQKVADDGTAQVTVEIDMAPLWDTIVFYQKKFSIVIK